MRKGRVIRWLILGVVASLLCPALSFSQVQERFPKPDFETDYVRPDLVTPSPRATGLEYLDIVVLVLTLSLATYFIHKQRSRRNTFFLMIFALLYFGFFREGCICSIGAIQNISLALFNSGYAIPISAIGFFILPLIAALFYGRTFCAAVCPLGAIQDVVVLKPIKVHRGLDSVLGFLPYLYLGLAVLFAATGTGFIICRYDPFVGFFRFGAGFNMVVFGVSLLILGTVVARPYCRYLCPFGVLLSWMSHLSRRHVHISPSGCNNCRLCEASCPFGAIIVPQETAPPDAKKRDVKRTALAIGLLPVFMLASGWIGSRLEIPLARQHATVSLAEEILLEESGQRTEMTDATEAFRSLGKPTAELFSEATAIRNRMRIGGWFFGGFMGLVIGLKFFGLHSRKRRLQYEVDKGRCLSCARCFSYCPYEQVRLGLVTMEEADRLGTTERIPKQFRA